MSVLEKYARLSKGGMEDFVSYLGSVRDKEIWVNDFTFLRIVGTLNRMGTARFLFGGGRLLCLEYDFGSVAFYVFEDEIVVLRDNEVVGHVLLGND